MNVQPTMSVLPDGAQMWRLPSGHLHRDDGPAITYPNGFQFWFQHGERHRVDGPASTHPNGYEAWFQHDQRHRIGGPAITRTDGTEEWWINGVQVTEFEHAVVARAHTLAEQGRPNPMPQS